MLVVFILIRTLLLFTVFILPLLGPVSGIGYEAVKVLLFIVSTSLIGLIWMGKGVYWTKLNIAGLLFILTLIITSFTGIDPKSGLLGRAPYFQGAIFYAYLFLFFLIVSNIKFSIKSWAWVLAGSGGLVALIAVKQWIILNLFSGQVLTYAGRVVSTFGQPNFYAGYLLLVLPFSYILYKDLNKKIQLFGFGSALILFLGIIVSYSRSAIFLSLILLVLALFFELRIKKHLVIIFAVLILAVFASIKYSSGFIFEEFIKPFLTINPDLTRRSVENRMYIWPQAYKIALQKPLTGYGPENISGSFSNYFDANKHALFEENLNIYPVLISLKDLKLDRTHNYILDLFLFSGIPGVFTWIIFIVLLFGKTRQGVLLISLVTYSLWIQFQNQSAVHLVYFWFLAGLIENRSIDRV